ncbi:choline-binding transcriptional repressor BetI [Kordiimonas gwangyangensis]|uniref:choline-binding transcriptional repressor BetI n=1 Tax=Kordiimonas gwangyangensis TaxID=288022 RepID=UPI00035E32B7|nr:transcriptional regulator BetI [Kordiimonas gwangyangensis]
MPKVGMQPIRRQQLIDATLRTIARVGYSETTVSRIAKEASLSVGIISHYFGGKQALLEASMAYLLFELHDAFLIHLEEASTPRERLSAIIAVNFAHDQYAPGTVRAWLSFWAQVPFSPELARLQRIYNARLMSNLAHELGAFMPREGARTSAEVVASLIDGFWLRSTVGGVTPDLVKIRAQVEATLDRLIAS